MKTKKDMDKQLRVIREADRESWRALLRGDDLTEEQLQYFLDGLPEIPEENKWWKRQDADSEPHTLTAEDMDDLFKAVTNKEEL